MRRDTPQAHRGHSAAAKRTLALLKRVRAAVGEKDHGQAEGLLRKAIASEMTPTGNYGFN